MKVSNCGLLCDECEFYQNPCSGCYEVKGQTFWAKESDTGMCPLFDCSVNQKQLKSCGDCCELPCNKFKELKDPNISDEEHERKLIERVERLNTGNKYQVKGK